MPSFQTLGDIYTSLEGVFTTLGESDTERQAKISPFVSEEGTLCIHYQIVILGDGGGGGGRSKVSEY